jgi:hypothetical protein
MGPTAQASGYLLLPFISHIVHCKQETILRLLNLQLQRQQLAIWILGYYNFLSKSEMWSDKMSKFNITLI